MSDVGIGIIGSRFLAETRARCYAQVNGARIVAVASRTEDSARTYAERHGIDRAFTDYRELLADPEVPLHAQTPGASACLVQVHVDGMDSCLTLPVLE